MRVLAPEEITMLKNKAWRLNNLYMVVDENGNAIRFKMRDCQAKLLENMDYRNLVLKARQLGFSTFIQLYIFDTIFWTENLRAAIIAHTKDAAQTIFRDKIKFAYEHLPTMLQERNPATKMDAGEMMLENNSSVKVTTSARSGTCQLLHVSEIGRIGAKYPHKAKEIMKGSIPAVHEGGFIFIESTAEGREGVYYDLCQDAINRCAQDRPLSPMEFRMHFYPWYENPTNVTAHKNIVVPDRLKQYFKDLQALLKIKLTKEQMAWYTATEGLLGEDMKAENPSTAEEAFEVSIEGAYYKKQMDKAYADGRVGLFPYDPDYPVDTAWDIGHADATAIWFRQTIGKWHHIIDYEEMSGEDLPYFVKVLKDKPYKYRTHIAPHDINKTDWGTGHTALEQALTDHKLPFRIAPNLLIIEGIQVVRKFLGKCKFNEETCDDGLKVLTSYRKEWNEKMGCWRDKPRHDSAEHGASAMRYLAVSEPGSGKKETMTKSSIYDGCAQ